MQCHRRRQRARCGALAAYSPGRAADLSWRHGADVRRRPGAPAQHGRCRMTPSVDERFASVIRALTEVVLPHLPADASLARWEEHTSELQSLMRISYAVCCLQKNTIIEQTNHQSQLQITE